MRKVRHLCSKCVMFYLKKNEMKIVAAHYSAVKRLYDQTPSLVQHSQTLILDMKKKEKLKSFSFVKVTSDDNRGMIDRFLCVPCKWNLFRLKGEFVRLRAFTMKESRRAMLK